MEASPVRTVRQKRIVPCLHETTTETSVPQGTPILTSVLATTVKATEIENLWNLNIRHCMNGKSIRGVEQYGPSYTPAVSADSLRFQLGYSAALNFIVRSYDCTNAFQCTYEPDARKRVYCRLPPLYLQWYNYRYSWDSLESTDGPFVLQAGQVIQGTPHAGYSWYINIHKRLCLHGYKRNSTDMGF